MSSPLREALGSGTVCSGTGIVILWNCDFGRGFRIRDLFRKLHLQIFDSSESYMRKKVEVVQHSRVGDYLSVPSLLEQRPTERP